jgi:Spy/CpxP family protein refolding chaperone
MRTYFLLALNAVAMSFATALFAQTRAPAPPAAATEPAGSARTLTADQIVRFYDAKLGLTDDQKAQLKPIVAERQRKAQELRGDTSMRPRERLKKAQAISEAADKQIAAVLTPEQRKKYAEVEKELKEQTKERRQEKM